MSLKDITFTNDRRDQHAVLTYDPQLNPTELEIYKYISHNIEKVPYMTIRELADEIHFSKTAIWRFVKIRV